MNNEKRLGVACVRCTYMYVLSLPLGLGFSQINYPFPSFSLALRPIVIHFIILSLSSSSFPSSFRSSIRY